MLPDPLFLNVHMYGIMVALGVLAAFGVLYLYNKKLGVSIEFTDFIFYDGVLSVMAGFGFAALWQAVYDYIEDPSRGFHFGGITFLGGAIGGAVIFFIGYFLFRKKLNGRFTGANMCFPVVSVIPCMILIGHSLGRVGCFFAGCCYGKPTDFFLGVTFPGMSGPVHPTQLYEAFFLLVMFGVTSFLLLKYRFRHNMSVYLIGYGIFRFLIEFIRGDHRGELVAGLTPSQFWSLLMVIGGVVLYFVLKRMFARYDGMALNDAESMADKAAKELSEEAQEPDADAAEVSDAE
ncbi:MAG: prolipoprotein diacylglyceryl transferase [Clostridia bacterium]|nr:prolipoprotein diacylglyceryl transferase [Clostridia bacterium]